MKVPLKRSDAILVTFLGGFVLGSFFLPYERWKPETAPRRECSEIPHLDRPVDFVVDFYGFKYQGRSDNLIDSNVLHCGAWEKPVLYFLRDVMLAKGTGGGF